MTRVSVNYITALHSQILIKSEKNVKCIHVFILSFQKVFGCCLPPGGVTVQSLDTLVEFLILILSLYLRENRTRFCAYLHPDKKTVCIVLFFSTFNII